MTAHWQKNRGMLPVANLSYLEKHPDFVVSWAGPGPTPDTLFFGAEDGRIAIASSSGKFPPQIVPRPVNADGEAINSIAILGKNYAVSSRSELVLIYGDSGVRAIFPGGTHRVLATLQGEFVAAGGRAGLLFMTPNQKGETIVTARKVSGEEFYYYKIAVAQDMVVCAVGTDGVLAASLEDKDDIIVRSMALPGIDIVDVCALENEPTSRAFAAVGIDGTVVLYRDVMDVATRTVLQFDLISGTAYRVLSARGHLFLLTSNGIYGVAKFVDRFLGDGLQTAVPTTLTYTPILGVDVEKIHEDHLLVVLADDRILAIEIENLANVVNQVPAEQVCSNGASVEIRSEAHNFTPRTIPPEVRNGTMVSSNQSQPHCLV